MTGGQRWTPIYRQGQDELERGLVEILKRRCDRKVADEFRDQAVLEKILWLDVAENLALLSILGRDDLGAKADRARPATRRNDLLKSGEGAATDEQDIGAIDLKEFLLRILAPCGGTRAIVPSMILSSACCTPSPETSRGVEACASLSVARTAGARP